MEASSQRSPSCPAASRTLGKTGMSVMVPALPLDGQLPAPGTGPASSARAPTRPPAGPEDAGPRAGDLPRLEAQFMSDAEKDRVSAARNRYPRRKPATPRVDPLTGELDDVIPRRVMGFNLGFEKVLKTTSYQLPVAAHSIFAELHAAHNGEVFSRRFNGLNTVFDLKKWIYEKLLVPMNAYDLSYAEPGKASLTDQLRLLTTQDSLDTRTLVTTRAVQRMYKGLPGVHCTSDVGVTRLYVRLKCRTCGDLLNSLQKCRKYTSFGDIEVQPDPSIALMKASERFKTEEERTSRSGILKTGAGGSRHFDESFVVSLPGSDPGIEDCWYRPDEKKHCLFHTLGYEIFEAARGHGAGPGGQAELARIYISSGKEPSKKLGLFEMIPKSAHAFTKIAY